ncbi:retrovirus-related Pol polyprotein from transposon opus [Nephila pilipes]|uniref:Retrovirus-related Pol polyprotein from transposon opus n=1 Tax=Nephila pilipes TaxID=299642 RepID=A0A8X6TSU6_NEPPI|nr:retrovirus-related Pol polyprotein from transposon opus [Nephila pilipes]
MGADQVEYLGYLITAEGSCPLPEKVEAINNYKMPTIHELRTFLGMINFYRRFGVPATITDKGRQCESQLFRKIAAICGAKVGHTTPYYPQCNRKVERLHRTLKGAIKVHNNIKWTESLPTVLLGLRATLRPDVNHTIAQMVYGTCMKLIGKQVNISVDRLKPAYLLEPDHDNEQTTAEHKNTTPNPVDPHLMSDKQPTTSRGRKINTPVRFRE